MQVSVGSHASACSSSVAVGAVPGRWACGWGVVHGPGMEAGELAGGGRELQGNKNNCGQTKKASRLGLLPLGRAAVSKGIRA